MGAVTVIGLDIAKSVFQVHGVDAAGTIVIQRQIRRGQVLTFFASLPPCLIGIEACATAHHWSRELQQLGHQVRLMPPAYVKPYGKRQKNDRADAEAICAAVTRPTMRFVEPKTCEQQSVLMRHRVRFMLVKQRTMLTNAIRAHLAEFGLVARVGREGADELVALVREGDAPIPDLARACVLALAEQLVLVKHQILEMDRRITAHSRASEVSRRLAEIPGVGPLLASALVAHVPDPRSFSCGRNLAAWIGLVPKQSSSGGKERLGGVTKQGNRYLRSLLTVGALAVIRYAQRHGSRRPWIVALLARRATKARSKGRRTALLACGQFLTEPGHSAVEMMEG